jgi:hypothetical protein
MANNKLYDPGLQYLVITQLKNAGLGDEGKVVFFDDAESSGRVLGLRPILLYALVRPIEKQYFKRLVDSGAPESISSFLQRAWSFKGGVPLPDRLESKASLLEADKGFLSWVENRGVTMAPAASLKTLVGFERAAQEVRVHIEWTTDGYRDRSLALPLAEANPTLERSLESHNVITRDSYVSNDNIAASRAAPWRHLDPDDTDTLSDDWDSTHLKVQAPQPRADAWRCKPDEELNFYVSGAKDVITLWPGGRGAFAKQAGVTRLELDNWLSERSHFPTGAIYRAEGLLNVNFVRDYDDYVYEGALILVANGRKATRAAYEELSHGGDLCCAVEIVGPSDVPCTHRFLYLEAWGSQGNIIIFKSDGPESSLLDDGSLINLMEPLEATPEAWAEVLLIVGSVFAGRHTRTVPGEFAARNATLLQQRMLS